MNCLCSIPARLNQREEDESGSEAAQVILILVIVVLGIVPVLKQIRNAINSQGSSAVEGILNANN